jgi:hypothetical protein
MKLTFILCHPRYNSALVSRALEHLHLHIGFMFFSRLHLHIDSCGWHCAALNPGIVGMLSGQPVVHGMNSQDGITPWKCSLVQFTLDCGNNPGSMRY